MSSTYYPLDDRNKNEYHLSCGEETLTKRVFEWLRLRILIILIAKFSPSYFLKKRLSRRDTDKRFHLSTAQDLVKIPRSLMR
jgi:hypothetical protein